MKNGVLLQLLCTFQLAEIAVEGTERYMSSFASYFQNQAIREAQRRTLAEMLESGCDDVRILDDEIPVIEQDLDRRSDLSRTMAIDRAQDPQGLDKDEVRYPRPFGDERLGGGNLPGVVSDRQSDQDVDVNGAHSGS